MIKITRPRFAVPILGWALAATVAAIGAFGQYRDASAGPSTLPVLAGNLHTLFGFLLCTAVVLRFSIVVGRFDSLSIADVDALSRRLARQVYLLIYALAGLRETLNIEGFLSNGGAFDFGWCRISLGEANPLAVLAPVDDFRVYIAYAIAALLINNMLTQWHHRRDQRLNPARFEPSLKIH